MEYARSLAQAPEGFHASHVRSILLALLLHMTNSDSATVRSKATGSLARWMMQRLEGLADGAQLAARDLAVAQELRFSLSKCGNCHGAAVALPAALWQAWVCASTCPPNAAGYRCLVAFCHPTAECLVACRFASWANCTVRRVYRSVYRSCMAAAVARFVWWRWWRWGLGVINMTGRIMLLVYQS